ncbi:MAG: DMT family transporter [Deltaproteobacteria bacterium]|nr:DMT family transporter [Deltaproteobacteria bacterium]
MPRKVWVFLAIGLAAASQSGNLIRIGDAHPAAIAAWRLLMAAALLAPVAGRDLKLVMRLTRKEVVLLLLAGLALAAHFFAWIAAVQLTTIANAAVFFSINPVITATAGFLIFGERASRRLAISIAVGLLGVAALGWNDVSFSPEGLPGDGAALACSVLFTAYFLLGKRLRRVLPTGAYVTAVYGVAAVFSFIALLLLGEPLVAYDGRTWLCFGLMALVPTVIGHTSFNNALKYIDAGRISAYTLSEPLLAGLVAYLAWDEEITLAVLVGYALVSASVLILVSEGDPSRTRPGEPHDDTIVGNKGDES